MNTAIFQKCECSTCLRRAEREVAPDHLRDGEHVLVSINFMRELRAYVEEKVPRCRCGKLAFLRVDEPGPTMKSTFVCEEHRTQQVLSRGGRVVSVHASAKKILGALERLP